MKRNMTKGTGRPAHAFKTLLAGAAMTAALGFAMNAQAGTPDCTVGNWAAANALADANSGHQGTDNRRYGGPCGLRVAVDGTARFLESPNLAGENTYHVRFYAFMDNAGSGAVELFQTDAFSIFYENGDVTMDVDHAGGTDTLVAANISPGWHSIHASWDSNSGDVSLAVANRDGEIADDGNFDLSAMSITFAHLGNVNGANTGGSLDFDDFVSTRITPPDRLLVGDANDSDNINVSDLVAILTEIDELGFASGQPDCNENGSINVSDMVCVLTIIDSL